jgi:hypothetical protein
MSRRWPRGLARPSRRSLLAAGGGALAAPFLPTMRRARADVPAGAPKRLLIFHHSQGTVLPDFVPEGSQTDFTLPHILTPLAAHQDRMVLFTGVDNRMPSFNTVGNAHHNGNLTLFPAQPFAVQDSNRLSAGGPSIEQVLATRIGDDTPFRRLDFAIGGSTSGGFRTTDRFWYGPDDPVVAYNDPFVALARIFGDQTVSPEDAWALRARRSAVLDAVMTNANIAGRRLGPAERVRLDAHVDKLEQLAARISGGVGECAAPGWSEPAGYDQSYDDDVTAPIMNEIVVSALSCGYTRVATVELANGHDHAFPWLWARNGGPIVDTGSFDNWHAMVHADYQPGMEHVYRWYMEVLADLLDRMAVSQDPDGDNLLDTTLVLYIPEFSSGRHWTGGLCGFVLGDVGTAGGGRWLDFFDGGYESFIAANSYQDNLAHTNQLWTSLLQRFGQPDTGFGHAGDGAVMTDPLPGLFDPVG